MTAEQLAQQMGAGSRCRPLTWLRCPSSWISVNELSYALQGAQQREVAKARTYAQSFTSIFGKKVPPSYLDLGHFVQLLSDETRDAASRRPRMACWRHWTRPSSPRRHGPEKPGATGISIYFPNSQLFRSPVTGA